MIWRYAFSPLFDLSPSLQRSFLLAYNVALAANFISGIISVVLGLVGPQMLSVIPPAALLVPVAGIGFAFLGLEQAAAPFGSPIVGFMVKNENIFSKSEYFSALILLENVLGEE